MALLDHIETEDQSFDGIIDYVNKKHIVFFDTTRNDSPEVVLLVISWRCTYQEQMRFSLFRDIFFPNIEIPVVLIPRKNIIGGTEIEETISPSSTRKKIRR